MKPFDGGVIAALTIITVVICTHFFCCNPRKCRFSHKKERADYREWQEIKKSTSHPEKTS